ncbi:GNAT family N-acetyltransferase [Anaeromyxobacter sp. SG26]|uniref:GNAT family N-acetyltransferase n=1 Tax=Anaeromyxobacter sp. SG26 TaxID=2925407 RepID=UPI001F5A8350|nr:GNAT family N-acetyltransferase [Anaeromyxobacter sp. SG26]
MRREIFRADPARALALLARAPVVHLATTTPAGAPVLRAFDAAVLEDGVFFHGAHAGEKATCLGRPAVVSAEEVVAHVPSWMVDPVRACPATTLFRSVQVHGTLTAVEDPATKARALEALMRRWQPEGRYRPIDAGDPLYRGELAGVRVFFVPFERIDGKWKLLQNRTPGEIERILLGLWERGAPGDPQAIEAIREANPAAPTPPFLAAEGVRLHAALGPEDLPAVETLLGGEYWWEGVARELIGPAHLGATAWVGARSPDGALVASARAVSDGRRAWIYDVVVARSWRGQGLGKRVTTLLLDHPAVRRTRFVCLATRDAQGLYARYGFVDVAATPPRFPGSSDMVLDRAAGLDGARREAPSSGDRGL